MTVGRSAARAAGWAFVATAGAKVITLVGLALLARLLAPREFGLLAFALAYMTYADTIGDLGSGMALVYWPDRRDDASQVTFLVSIAAGICWCGITLLLAPFIADFFHAANGAPIVRALSFTFIIRYLGNTHDALAQKDLRFHLHVVPEFSLALANAAVALALAWLGFGAWSLVWGRLAGTLCRTLLLWAAIPWRPTLRVPWDLVRPMLTYGRSILMINGVAAITNNTDLVVVGHMLGTTVLGLYQMAAKIPETTVMTLLWVLARVLFPAFAKLHAAGESLRRPFLVTTRYISAITIPAAIGLAVLSRPIVHAFFGPQWLASAPILSMLAIAAALRCLTAQAGDLLKAMGRARLVANFTMVKAVFVVIAVLIGARWGAVAIASGMVAATALTSVVILVIAAPVIGVSLREMAGAFFPGIAGGCAMIAPLIFWIRATDSLALSVQVAGGVMIGALVHAIVVALLDPELVRAARQHFFPRGRAEVTT
jgi:O-antigen/teichoic acid export membrane protein